MSGFREAVRNGNVLAGSFIKTASHVIPELFAAGGLDFGVIDAEHAAFDAMTLDAMLLAGRAAGLPCLVRVPNLVSTLTGQVLDGGAAGIVMPHVATPEAAHAAVAAAKYGPGLRGFSPSTRAGAYGGRPAANLRAEADRESTLWVQIEDAEALSHLDAIAAIEDIDCLFIGRVDLAASLGVSAVDSPDIIAAMRATIDAARCHRRAVGIYVSGTAEIAALRALGISVFACGSDQTMILEGGKTVRESKNVLF
jgi:2-keto-3-deoxy-L-rhamnonate aldolase RhmA